MTCSIVFHHCTATKRISVRWVAVLYPGRVDQFSMSYRVSLTANSHLKLRLRRHLKRCLSLWVPKTKQIYHCAQGLNNSVAIGPFPRSYLEPSSPCYRNRVSSRWVEIVYFFVPTFLTIFEKTPNYVRGRKPCLTQRAQNFPKQDDVI